MTLALDNPRRVLTLFVLVCAVPGLALGVLTWGVMPRYPLPAPWDVIAVRDYLNVWAGGKLAMVGDFSTLFHPAQYDRWLARLFGGGLQVHTWCYPPSAVFLAVPLAALPLIPGFIVWVAGSVTLLMAVLRRCQLPWLTCVAVLCSPAVIENVLAGQNGAITASLLEGGLLLVGRSSVMAGLSFGLLTMKPHLGLLVPLCLAAFGAWRTAVVAAGTAAAVIAASALAFGPETWEWFLTDVRHYVTATILERPFEGTYQNMMATPFILARWLGATLSLAYAVQGVVLAGCASLAWQAWRKPGADPKARTALTSALALLATPYAYSYDSIGVAVGIAMLASMALQTGFRPFEALLLAAAWAWPGLPFWLAGTGLPPFGCLTLAGVAWCAWRRLEPAAAFKPVSTISRFDATICTAE